MVFLVVGNELLFWVRQIAGGVWQVPRDLPLQLCDLAVFLVGWALCQPQRPRVAELAYCWGLAATSQALLTPDLPPILPVYVCWKFFLTHGGVVVSVIYLAAGLGWRPARGAVWRVWGVTNLYAAAIGLFNLVYGANKLYLCAKPLRPSLLDWMGPWPWYILSMELLALALFWLCTAPFFVADRAARRRHVRLAAIGAALLLASGTARSAEAPASEPAPAETGWEAQGDWLVNTERRCQLRKPALEGWDFAQDQTAGWVIAYHAPQMTVEVLCEVRDENAAPRQMARAALAHAYGRGGEPQHFLPQARSQQRQVTFQGVGAMQVLVDGPYSTGVWRTDRYLIFRRKQLLIVLHAMATPKEAYEAQRQAIEETFNSLTWF